MIKYLSGLFKFHFRRGSLIFSTLYKSVIRFRFEYAPKAFRFQCFFNERTTLFIDYHLFTSFFFLPSINAYLRARTRVMPSAVTVNTRGTVLLVDNSLGGLEVNIIVNSTHMHRTILRPMIEETERGRGI